MKLLEKHKIKNDSWVELSGGIWRCCKGGKAAYKSKNKHMVGDPDFITGNEYIHIGIDRYWWG